MICVRRINTGEQGCQWATKAGAGKVVGVMSHVQREPNNGRPGVRKFETFREPNLLDIR